jgi:predicted amidohydrolase
MDEVKLSVVQPRTFFGAGARERNLEQVDAYVAEAARQGADLVTLPETYPGEWAAPVTWTPENELNEIAERHGVFLVGGFAEPLDSDGMRCYNTLTLHSPDGVEIGRYRRTTPSHTPWIYKGGRYWDFDWVNATDLPVFETDLGKIGIVMCSEVYATECSRALALKGADIALLPAGLVGPHTSLYATWRTLVWARAIENLMFTAVCSNIPVPDDAELDESQQGGIAMICSPEEILVEENAEGVFTAALDMERMRLLRSDHDRLGKLDDVVYGDLPWRTKPGTLRDWRRDAVLKANPVLLQGSPDPE